MKHGKVTTGLSAAVLSPLAGCSRCAGLRGLAVLGPLAGIAASLAWALPARGGDVPFTEHVISTNAIGAQAVFAIDLDDDGEVNPLDSGFVLARFGECR